MIERDMGLEGVQIAHHIVNEQRKLVAQLPVNGCSFPSIPKDLASNLLTKFFVDAERRQGYQGFTVGGNAQFLRPFAAKIRKKQGRSR
jgi:hypothetical protein